MDLIALLKNLSTLPRETEWLEFKLNNAEPEMIGERISAIANSAVLFSRKRGYVIWGVTDDNHDLVGTSFNPDTCRFGNEPLENWLHVHLFPKVDFRFCKFTDAGRNFVILDIPAARGEPLRFNDHRYIRVGSVTKKLRDHPDKERELWRLLSKQTFEADIAAHGVREADLFELLSFKSYYSLTSTPEPPQPEQIKTFIQENLVERCDDGTYEITNLGAILFAKNLNDFGSLERKGVRLIEYESGDRTTTRRETQGKRGYAAGFGLMISHLEERLPSNEVLEKAIRRDVPQYPPIAIRELSANALIHQELSVSGVGPMIEIFKDRIEFTNPGEPLISPDRFIDLPPKSRNEKLARLMRRLGVCEERGSGIDKVITAVELFQLPPPSFRAEQGSTKVTLYAPKPLRDMDREDRIRACYQHACLMFVTNQKMTNASLRKRFAISDENSAQASRYINEALEARAIKDADPANTSRRYAEYLPIWA